MPSEHLSEVKGDRRLSNVSDMLLVIKKPDFLGKSQWSFRHGRANFAAPIVDEDWLHDFHSGKHPLSPGDALMVRVRFDHLYSESGDLIESEKQIVKVVEVIKMPVRIRIYSTMIKR